MRSMTAMLHKLYPETFSIYEVMLLGCVCRSWSSKHPQQPNWSKSECECNHLLALRCCGDAKSNCGVDQEQPDGRGGLRWDTHSFSMNTDSLSLLKYVKKNLNVVCFQAWFWAKTTTSWPFSVWRRRTVAYTLVRPVTVEAVTPHRPRWRQKVRYYILVFFYCFKLFFVRL